MAPNPLEPGTAREQIARSVRARHPAHDQSDPPASTGDIDALPHVERHARWWAAVQKIGAGVVFVGGLALAFWSWSVNAAVNAKLDGVREAFRRQLDPSVLRPTSGEIEALRAQNLPVPPTIEDRFNATAVAIADVKKAIGSPSDPQSDIGKKLDVIDDLLRKELAKKNRPAPPAIGPTARLQGMQ